MPDNPHTSQWAGRCHPNCPLGDPAVSLLCTDRLHVQVTQLSSEHGADLMLNKEARKWSAKVVRDMRTVRSTMKEINHLSDQIHAGKVFFEITFSERAV